MKTTEQRKGGTAPIVPHVRGLPGLRPRREALGLSQTEAAKRIGVARATYANWEAERAVPLVRYLPAITALLGCSMRELLFPEEEA